MKRRILVSLVIASVFIATMAIYLFNTIQKRNETVTQLSAEFPQITRSQELTATISKIYQPHPDIFNNDPLQAYLLLDDSSKRRITTGHEINNRYTLDEILEIGVELRKRGNSDVLTVYKFREADTIVYSFELRDDLGYPLK